MLMLQVSLNPKTVNKGNWQNGSELPRIVTLACQSCNRGFPRACLFSVYRFRVYGLGFGI